MCVTLIGCSDGPLNNPYAASSSSEAVFYDSFRERPKHLDPVSSYSENEARFNSQIYEPVVQYHYLKRPYELTPLTAVALPEPTYFDPSGQQLAADAAQEDVQETVYRIQIQPGIMYQPHPAFARNENNGFQYHTLTAADLEHRATLADFELTGSRELVAEDYVYQIKRLVHPHLHSPIAGLMGKYIKGLPELSTRVAADEHANDSFVDLRAYDFAGAKAVDRYTYEIRLTQKYPQFRYWLAMPFFAPVPWEADAFYNQPGMKARNISLDWYPIGTGPYMLAENNPNRRMVLVKNPNFRGELYPTTGAADDASNGLLASADQRMPFIDVAHYSLEKEAIPGWTKFLQGYYDASSILSDSFDQAIQFNPQGEAQLTNVMREKGINLVTAVTTSISYLGFNMVDNVVGGDTERARKLRRAISIAIDYEELISIFANGRGVPAQGPIPPGIFGQIGGPEGINPYVYEWRDGHPVRKSVAAARELLSEAGYPDGRDAESGEQLTLYFETVSSGPGSKAMLNWYRKQFDKLGIQLVIRATDYNRFQEKIRKGSAQIFGWGWNADYPDPENFLFLLYGPNAKVASQGENAVNYQNPRFDELFVRMRSMSDGSERQELINDMTEILRRDSPWVWGFHPTGYTLYHDWYGNVKPNLMARNTLKYKTIDAQLRERKRGQWNDAVVWPVAALFVVLLISALPAWRTYVARQRAAAR